MRRTGHSSWRARPPDASASPVPAGAKLYLKPGERRVTIGSGTEEQVHLLELERGEAGTLRWNAMPRVSSAPEPPPSLVTHHRASERPTAAEPTRGTNPYRTAGFAALGVGAAGFALALVAGIVTLSTDEHLEGVCDAEGVCPAAEAGAVNRRNTAAKATNIGLVTGTVGAALGLSLVLLAPKDRSDTAMSIRATPTSLHFRGHF